MDRCISTLRAALTERSYLMLTCDALLRGRRGSAAPRLRGCASAEQRVHPGESRLRTCTARRHATPSLHSQHAFVQRHRGPAIHRRADRRAPRKCDLVVVEGRLAKDLGQGFRNESVNLNHDVEMEILQVNCLNHEGHESAR